MNRSTKILITLAILLFVIPVGAVVLYTASTNVDSKEYAESVKKEGQDPNAQDHFLVTHKLKTFNNIHIASDGYSYVNLYLVESKDYAVKVDKRNEGHVVCSIDASGGLKIESNPGSRFSMISIYVFAPVIGEVHLSNMQIGNLETNLDSLRVVGDRIANTIRFGENKKLARLSLSLTNSNINLGSALEDWAPNELEALKVLSLNLDKSTLALNTKNYHQIDAYLNNSGLSNAFFERRGEDSVKYAIEDLNLTTIGNSRVEFDKVLSINRVSGNLSDSTVTSLPISLLRDLIK
ncbi:hypothetical protein [Sphingobacterium yanglingense]|uniref:Uncharacterized protein n=1 Tax=Sphingobacterium yanglingense TaxID=1437280 RepID=A0A4R6WGT0_9SPHI|nr:hypothetical protein [Sphingobacterium yanglingense]TDQ77443.1 hypothetical protein CLV99_2849 [Sphingobacterium yanglingense]